MNFNNTASSSNIKNNLNEFERDSGDSINNVASAASKIGSTLGPLGLLAHTNNNAPAFNKGGYFKLFKK